MHKKHIILLLLPLLFHFASAQRQVEVKEVEDGLPEAPVREYDPKTNPDDMVISGNVRFSVLSEMLIRMEYAPDGVFNDNATLTMVNRRSANFPFSVYHVGPWLNISTSHLHLQYKENSGRFTAANLKITYQYNDSLEEGGGCGGAVPLSSIGPEMKSFTWKPGMKDHKNLKGTTRTLDGALGKFSFGQLKKLPIEDGILSRSGWAFIDDSHRPLFDTSDWAWVKERKDNGAQDWYFFGYGYHYRGALQDFVSVSGKISLPPKFAFGIWYSRYWKYSEQDMKDIVNDYAKNDIPLDVLVVDMDWHMTESSEPQLFKNFTPKQDGWTGFTWEKKYFPDYKEFLKWTDDHKIQTCLNIHPASGVQAHEVQYPAFAKALNFDTTGRKSIPFDITNKKFAQAYFDVLLHPYEKAGVDFWWLDWQQWGGTNIKGVNPTFYLNYVHYSDMQRQGKRPLIFHRYGGLGNQRYQIGFSGDCIIDWRSLSYQPEFTATAANVGYGYWSHDIGGHMNPVNKFNKQDPELFTRWVQWGAFSPIFRTHATADGEIERRIWKYPEENFKAMRLAIQMRYALVPYIYTCAHMSYTTGVSLVHPMYYDEPTNELAYKLPHQYWFGENMIVAPVHESMKGQKEIEQKVWLPKGAWYDYHTGAVVKGDGFVSRKYALDEIPVFVKEGSIIPTQTKKMRLTGSVNDTLILTIYPQTTEPVSDSDIMNEQSATFTLYEDDGVSEGYKADSSNYTYYDYYATTKKRSFSAHPESGTYNGQPTERAYELIILNTTKPERVLIDGIENLSWRFDKEKNTLTINTPRKAVGDLSVEIF